MNPYHFPPDILEILTNQNIDKDVKSTAIVAFQKIKEEEEQTKRKQEEEQTKRKQEEEQTKREQEQTKRTWLYIFHKENRVNLKFKSFKILQERIKLKSDDII
jgi:hypothetical protein